jgi:hypothetical protein
MALSQRAAGLKHGWRSGLEERVAKELVRLGVDYRYEELTGEYHVPARTSRYTPDFLLWNGIIIETKGLWDTKDRQKIRFIVTQYPGLDFRMVFSNSRARISKQSKTTYADYCARLEIPFADKLIPESWTKEAIEEFARSGCKLMET